MLLNVKLSKLNKISFFQSNYSILLNNEIDIFLKSLSNENKNLLSVLKKIGYISSFKETEKGYRIYHKQ